MLYWWISWSSVRYQNHFDSYLVRYPDATVKHGAKLSLKKKNTNMGTSSNKSQNSISWRPRQWPTLLIEKILRKFPLNFHLLEHIVRSKDLNCLFFSGDLSAAWVRGLPDEQPDCPCSPPPQNTQCLRRFQVSIVLPGMLYRHHATILDPSSLQQMHFWIQIQTGTGTVIFKDHLK